MTDGERYERAAHAMQSGVAMTMHLDHQDGHDTKDTEPKHLRTGINSALVDTAALVRLLVEKGIITADEYWKALADEMEREKESYEKPLSERLGRDVTLA